MIKKVLVLAVLTVALWVGLASLTRQAGEPVMAAVSSGPDIGGNIAYVRGGALWLYQNGNNKQLTGGPEDRQDKRDAYPSISPDSSQIVYTRIDEGFSDLYVLDIAAPRPVALTDHRPTVEVGQVGIPGVQAGYNEQALWVNFPAWSPNGEEIAFTSDVGTEYPSLRVVDANGENQRKVGGGLDFSMQTVERPTWSPDGKRIAVANYLTNGAIGQIWSYNISAQRWTELTDSKEGAYDPAWSPDGEWIAFTMREGGKHNIYVVPTDSSKWEGNYPTPVKLTSDGGSRSPAWSPDGTHLAYVSLQGTTFDIYAGEFVADANADPALDNVQRLTENANVDAGSGISWGR